MRIEPILALLILLPIVNTTVVNISTFTSYIKENMILINQKKELKNYNLALEAQIDQYENDTSLKRSIKQELKHIENNEILLRIY